MATPERWLSVSEAGRALGLSRTSLLAAEEAGLLASLRTPGGHRRYRSRVGHVTRTGGP